MRFRDLPGRSLLLVLPALGVILLAVPMPGYPEIGSSVLAKVFFGWPKTDPVPNILGMSIWLVLFAPPVAFMAGYMQMQTSCGRMVMLLHRMRSRSLWYLRLCATLFLYLFLYLVAINAVAVLLDAALGNLALYRAYYLWSAVLTALYAAVIAAVAMVIQLFTGSSRAGFTLPFLLLLLPEIPVGLRTPFFYRLPQHYPMLGRSQYLADGGFQPWIAAASMLALLMALLIIGYFSLHRLADKK